jgi:hydroxyacylglutathione hydrolase
MHCRVAIAPVVAIIATVAAQTRSEQVESSLDVHWNEGAANCDASTQTLLQVHVYEPQTFILRQSLCASFEGNFLYLLVGSDKALLIDTGAIADSAQMPLARKVVELLPDKDNAKVPLLVVHTHSHLDHRAGDSQFASFPSVKVVPADLPAIQAFFGFTDWPNGLAQVEFGGRTVDVIPTPGHHPTHLAFYDRRTGILFSGDFLMPARLTIEEFLRVLRQRGARS